ncbi:dihydrolipoamide acetyltransferase family protein [Sphaerotilus microaerophilus]|uniref:Dihydrolipoamide acetyltransferase component of pyruvate dehydrogenase complex n=1 Tax=Sphaerotilus microaerophilus TaxID=2914710 RepID=A0ABN6PHL8_9BURK|nr:dihydrolipoamide acetyltransferase family protein [Sphaerotilus sp. FB-5]BDI03853.1 lipoamide acyltransferase component of branched-chain alpha-keto acid dehydrogenase complex [Sphaerotilus sp. FB-5]
MADFLMPALGADMETGTVVEWQVRPGDRVKSGDIVAVVETHKGAIDVECFLDGVIDHLAPIGQALPVGAVLAQVRREGEPQLDNAAAAPPAPGSATQPAAASAPVPAAAPVTTARDAPVPPTTRAKVSPAARRRAAELGLAAEGLAGSGADGAVTLADVEAAAAARSALPPPAPAPRPARGDFDPAQMRRAIAAAMGRSKREIPHYYLGSTVDFAAASAWLTAYNAERLPAERLLPAVLLLKACALALAELPQLNGFYDQDAFRPGAGVHLGWAISLRGGGLVAPAIHHADRLSLPELMDALRDLVQRARSGGLRSSELTDPTCTVTSLGERGAESVWGVIYPPQVAIVGFGRVVERPWVVAGQVLPRPLVQLTLAADHRASDGHLGGQLLAAIDRALQAPDRL